MNLSTQQRIRALIAGLSDIPNQLDDIAREEPPTSARAVDDLCHGAALIRHAIGRLETAVKADGQATVLEFVRPLPRPKSILADLFPAADSHTPVI
jgi:hypothetical protein